MKGWGVFSNCDERSNAIIMNVFQKFGKLFPEISDKDDRRRLFTPIQIVDTAITHVVYRTRGCSNRFPYKRTYGVPAPKRSCGEPMTFRTHYTHLSTVDI